MVNDSLFNIFINTLKQTLKTWDYYVNWNRILKNIEPIEKELNLLNSLIGKVDIQEKFIELVQQYPNVLKAIPILLAIRENRIEVLIDSRNFIYERYNFYKTELTNKDIEHLSHFVVNSGLGEMLTERKIKSLVDYALGIEVGMDTNARKNRGGTIMENIVEMHITDLCNTMGYDYIKQGTKHKIKNKWGIDIEIEESERSIDFIIRGKNNKLYFIEVNFYGGGGSKLKATAGEYRKMAEYWKKQGFEFIWITDGKGWKTTIKPLKEYYDDGNYLLNITMLANGYLKDIID
ncbi:MAG: type II restriction endonuclease [Spirochaetes bacterium]|nr:type II restriction endonuclease [Spirochaetota bacterium]